MLKKFGTILLALVLIASLAACGGGTATVDPAERAFETYSNIMQRLSIQPGHSGAYDIDFVMDMDMTILGETIETTSTGNMRMIVDGDDAEMSMTMYMDMGGLGSTSMEMYIAIEGGSLSTMQILMDGEEFPQEFLSPEMEAMFQDMFDDMLNVPEIDGMEDFTSVEIEEVNGQTIMHIVLDGESFSEFVLAAMEDELAMFGLDMDMTIEDIYMTIVTDSEDNPLSMSMEMHMHMEIDGEEISLSTNIEMFFNAFGDSVEIEMLV